MIYDTRFRSSIKAQLGRKTVRTLWLSEIAHDRCCTQALMSVLDVNRPRFISLPACLLSTPVDLIGSGLKHGDTCALAESNAEVCSCSAEEVLKELRHSLGCPLLRDDRG